MTRRAQFAYGFRIFMQIALLSAVCCGALAQDPSPQPLPAANQFRLTIEEDKYSALSNEPSCTGEAGLTLTCRAFLFTLQNKSTKIVRLSSACVEPRIDVERRDPGMGWRPVSRPKGDTCPAGNRSQVRLRPGETTEFATRLISAQRNAEPFYPGEYTLRATWALLGCTDDNQASDCLSALQKPPWPPIQVVSNEVLAESPELPDLGTMSFGFEVAMTRSVDPSTVERTCKAEDAVGIDCVVFHYKVRNTGPRGVRYLTMTCSFSGIVPEYRAAGSDWKSLPGQLRECGRNFGIEHPIPPGGTAEGDFVLKTLQPGYDLRPLTVPGKYGLRFKFAPIACFASPDARFCLTKSSHPTPVLSSELPWEAK